ncbi:MAG: hypothetical protein PVI57_01085 [Gemmatimonadota bacterium]|jgi:hypothetical protein
MASFLPVPSTIRRGCVCLFVTLAVSACHDAESDPTALLVTEESRPALLVDVDLPSLPDLIGRTGTLNRLSGAIDLWIGSWDEGADGSQALREEAYVRASGPLAEALGPAAVRDAHLRLGAALDATASLPAGEASPEMAARISEAERYRAVAAKALDDGRHADALVATLRGSDALRAVGPEGVARTLVARADRRLTVARRSDDADRTWLERGDRLLRGARLALEDRQWSTALRRAYYACQVLGVSPR